MSDPFPSDWDHTSTLPADLVAVVVASEVGWLQAVTHLGFVLASVLAGCEDEPEYRQAVGETLAKGVLEAARTGRIMGETVQ